MDGVRIKKLAQTNPNDLRGETWLWNIPGSVQLMLCRRKTGRISSHFHKGEDPSKRPEKLFIISGRVKFIFFKKSTGEREEAVCGPGTEIKIFPNIIHSTEALEDAVLLEARVKVFDKNRPDTYKEEI